MKFKYYLSAAAVVLSVMSLVGSSVSAAGYARTKPERVITKKQFFAKRVPAGHDFTKIKPGSSYKPKHLIVRFAPDTEGKHRSAAKHQATLNALGGGAVKRRLSASQGIHLIELPENMTVEEAVKAYNGREDVFYAEPDYRIEFFSSDPCYPTDTRFSELWGLHNIGEPNGTKGADIDALQAWELRTDADDIIVAVIDTGVDYNHVDLDDNMWVNSGEIPDNGVDDDGNGYVDDYRGYDFYYYNDSDPMDMRLSHGTHCAGIIGAEGDNGEGITGVCWNVKIMALKITDDYWGHLSNAVEAIEYAILMGAHITSNSWGGGVYNQSLKDEIDFAGANGVLFVTAAGNGDDPNNDLYPDFPGSYTSENIISVMATDRFDEIWSESHYGKTSVDIAAPGKDILSCYRGGGYGLDTGTSMAAPYVAGACALVWAANPDLTHLEVKDKILGSVDKLDCLAGKCVSEGRLNLHQAILLYISVVDDVDDLDCRSDEEEVTYTIEWENTSSRTYTDVVLIDHLPAGVTHPGGHWETDPPEWIDDPNYDDTTHTYTWDIGLMEPNDTGCVSITVTVTGNSEPGLPMRNVIELFDNDSNSLLTRVVEDTPICCWDDTDPNIIYVDQAAEGGNNGTDWDNAYTDLQDAFYRAENTTCGLGPYTIYVAQGTYNLNWVESDGYVLTDGMAVYGGFTDGCDFSERNPYKYKTILAGELSRTTRENTVVTMADNSLLDGVTVTGASDYGIYGDGCDFTVENCAITDNLNWGIYALDGNLTVKWCSVTDNGWHGIFHEGDGYTLTVENSQIKRNDRHGIYTKYSTPTVKNSVIAGNGSEIPGFNGMRIINPVDNPVIYNNTIIYNAVEGISFVDDRTISDANDKDWPDLQNCIIYFNNDNDNDDDSQMEGMSPDKVADYSCIQDCNEIESNSNINGDPNFAYTVNPNFPELYAENYHLSYNSPCRNRGNSALAADPNAMDIDGEDRIYDSYVDIGADEVCSCDDDLTEDDIYNAVDWNLDGYVNMVDFDIYARAWPSTPSDTNWDPRCEIADPNKNINLTDGGAFLDPNNWPWVACRRTSPEGAWMMMAAGGGESMMMTPMSMGFAVEPVEAEPAEMTEKQLVGVVKGIYEIMSFLDESFQADDLTAAELEDYVDFFGSILADLEEKYRK